MCKVVQNVIPAQRPREKANVSQQRGKEAYNS